MKLFRRKLIKRYKAAHHLGRRHLYQRPYIAPILGLLAGVAIVGGVLISRPHVFLHTSDLHVVFLSDDGARRQTLDTKAATVGDLIKKLPLNLQPQDVVEPSLDTPIVQDNFRINVYRARPVTVVGNDGQKIVFNTAARSARVVAESAGLTVYPEDNISFAPGNIARGIIGEEVIIDPATPVQLILYGTPLTERTHTTTVAQFFKEKNIKIDPKDTVTPALTTPITANLAVAVIRNGVQVVTIQQPIVAPVQYVSDPSLSFGATAVRQSGVPGKQAITYQIDVEGGVEISRVIIQQTTVQAPVPQIVAVGSVVDLSGDKIAVMAAAGISPSDYGYVDYIISHESNWDPNATNARSGAHGLPQALPYSKTGCNWVDAVCQLRWADGYATGRYGSWGAAYSHWVSSVPHGW